MNKKGLIKIVPKNIKERVIEYKNCKIYLSRESEIWYYSIIDLNYNGYEFCSSFSESTDTLKEMIDDLKSITDDYLENPDLYE